MKTIRNTFFILFFLCIHAKANAQYQLISQFGNLTTCDTMTQGPFCVWWDKSFGVAPADLDQFLDSLNKFRDICLQELNLKDPPNVANQVFINYYLHRPNDVFPTWFGNFMSSDSLGHAFVTIPWGYHTNYPNAAHETFHVFQFNHSSTGFDYAGDGQWYSEATANWFKVLQYPDEVNAYLTMVVLTRLPQLSLWYAWYNRPIADPDNWQRQTHQYALSSFLYYLTEVRGVPRTDLSEGFNANTSLYPQEYYYQAWGASVFRNYFMEWAAHSVNRFDYHHTYQLTRSEEEWDVYADQTDENEWIGEYTNSNSGWIRPFASQAPGAWAFNTIKLNNSMDKAYTFQLDGDKLNGVGDSAYFEAMVVVQSTTGSSFFPLNMVNNTEGSLTLGLSPNDTAAYFVIAAMPEVFSGTGTTKVFPYNAQIYTGVTSVEVVKNWEVEVGTVSKVLTA